MSTVTMEQFFTSLKDLIVTLARTEIMIKDIALNNPFSGLDTLVLDVKYKHLTDGLIELSIETNLPSHLSLYEADVTDDQQDSTLETILGAIQHDIESRNNTLRIEQKVKEIANRLNQ